MPEQLLETRAAEMETTFGVFRCVVFSFTESQDIVLVKGEGGIPLVRVQSACLPSTALSSTMCDCAKQIKNAQYKLSQSQFGILIYLINQEARGHGLLGKMDVMREINRGKPLKEAQIDSGRSNDLRTYEKIPLILQRLGVTEIDLLTGSSTRAELLRKYGVRIRNAVDF